MNTDPKTLRINELMASENLRHSPPVVPVGIFVQEALDLYNWCSQDKEILVQQGLDWKLAEEIPLRAAVLSELNSEWVTMRDMPASIREEWRTAFPDALKLRRELIHYFRHAFHGKPQLLATLKEMIREDTIPGILMSLFYLGELGNKHHHLLEKIHMDLTLLEIAKQKNASLSKLLASINSLKSDKSDRKNLRNKAFWHLKEAVDEVRRVGQFCFWKNQGKLRGYISAFKKKMNQKLKENKPILIKHT